MDSNQQQGEVNEELQTISLGNLYKNGVFQAISGIRENVNHYGYLTLIDKNRKSMNLYFTKETWNLVKSNFQIGDKLPQEMLLTMGVVSTKNLKEEQRYKLYDGTTQKYTSASDVWGTTNAEEELIKDIKSQFLASSDNVLKVNPEVVEEKA